MKPLLPVGEHILCILALWHCSRNRPAALNGGGGGHKLQQNMLISCAKSGLQYSFWITTNDGWTDLLVSGQEPTAKAAGIMDYFIGGNSTI